MAGKKGMKSDKPPVPTTYRKDPFRNVDQRRYLPKLYIAIHAELHGAITDPSPQESELATIAAESAAIRRGLMETYLRTGEISISDYTQAANVTIAALTRLGLKRRAKAMPSLQEYLAQTEGLVKP